MMTEDAAVTGGGFYLGAGCAGPRPGGTGFDLPVGQVEDRVSPSHLVRATLSTSHF